MPQCRTCHVTGTVFNCCVTSCARPTGCARRVDHRCAYLGCTRSLCDLHGLAVCPTHKPGQEACGPHFHALTPCADCDTYPMHISDLLDELGVPNGTLESPT